MPSYVRRSIRPPVRAIPGDEAWYTNDDCAYLVGRVYIYIYIYTALKFAKNAKRCSRDP